MWASSSFQLLTAEFVYNIHTADMHILNAPYTCRMSRTVWLISAYLTRRVHMETLSGVAGGHLLPPVSDA